MATYYANPPPNYNANNFIYGFTEPGWYNEVSEGMIERAADQPPPPAQFSQRPAQFDLSDPNSAAWQWVRDVYGQGDAMGWLVPTHPYGGSIYGPGITDGDAALADPSRRSRMATLAEAIAAESMKDPSFDADAALRSANLTPQDTAELQHYFSRINQRMTEAATQGTTLLEDIATNPFTYLIPPAMAIGSGIASGAFSGGAGGAEVAAGGAMDMGVGLGETFGIPSVEAGAGGLGGLTPVDLGQEVLPFTTDPSLADLGGIIDSGTGLPIGLESLGNLPNVSLPQTTPTPTVDLTASGGGTAPAPTMPPAVPEPDPTFGGLLEQTGAGQFEQPLLPGTGGGAIVPPVIPPVGASGGGTAPIGSTPPAGSAPLQQTGGSGALGRILDGSATAQDWAALAGNIAPTLLSMWGLNQQQDTMNQIAAQQRQAEEARYQDLVAREQARYEDVVSRENARLSDLIARDRERFGTLMGREDAAIARQRGDIEFGRSVGAPYRDRLAGLYADPSSFLSSPEVMAPVQQATDALARALSVKGNPAGSPAAMSEIQNYAANQLFGRLGQEKDRLAQFGGLSAFNQSGAAVPGIGTTLSGSVPAPGQLFSGSPSDGSGVGTQGGLSALMGGAQAGANMWGDLGRGIRNVMSLV